MRPLVLALLVWTAQDDEIAKKPGPPGGLTPQQKQQQQQKQFEAMVQASVHSALKESVKEQQADVVPRASLENAQTEIVKARAENFYTFATTLVITIIGSGGFAKWYADHRVKSKTLDYQNKLDMLKIEHANAIELARVTAETKNSSNDVELKALRADFGRLQKQFEVEEARCKASVKELGDRLANEEAETRSLQRQIQHQHDQIVYMQATGRKSAFAGWTINLDDHVMDVTPNAERNLLVPMGLKKSAVEGKHKDQVWPPAFAKILSFLDREASKRERHIAAAMNVVIHPDVPPLLIAKTLAQMPDGSPYGVQGIAIPMSAFVDLPADLAGGEANG